MWLAVVLGWAMFPLSCENGCSARSDGSLSARVVYVAPSGDDTARGSAAHPVQSIAGGVDRLGVRGGALQVASGEYGQFIDRTSHPRPIVIRGPATADSGVRTTRSVRIAGASLSGSTNLRFEYVAFDGPVFVQPSPLDRSVPAANIRFVRSEFTAPGVRCVLIRDGAQYITLDQVWIHDCENGVGGLSEPPLRASHITLRRSVLERFSVDAVLFSGWDNVKIAANRIHQIGREESAAHSDGIQIAGSVNNVLVARNRLYDSQSQLMLIQGDNGPIDGVRVINNVMYDSAGTGIQAGRNGNNFVFVNNTIWRTRFSALLLRAGSGGSPRFAVVNNILDGFSTVEGAKAADQRNNLIVGGSEFASPLDLKRPKVGFRNAARNDFRLRKRSVARRAGSRILAPPTDFDGTPRPAEHWSVPVMSGRARRVLRKLVLSALLAGAVLASVLVGLSVAYRIGSDGLISRTVRFSVASEQLLVDVRDSAFTYDSAPRSVTLARRATLYAALAVRRDAILDILSTTRVTIADATVAKGDGPDGRPLATDVLREAADTGLPGIAIVANPSVPFMTVAARAPDPDTASRLTIALATQLKRVVSGPTRAIGSDDDVVIRAIGGPQVDRLVDNPGMGRAVVAGVGTFIGLLAIALLVRGWIARRRTRRVRGVLVARRLY